MATHNIKANPRRIKKKKKKICLMAIALLSPLPSPPLPTVSALHSSHHYSLSPYSSSLLGNYRTTHNSLQHLKVSCNATNIQETRSSKELQEIKDSCSTWKWRGFNVNFLVKGSSASASGPPLLLVHGFGASVAHWRRNISVLSECYTVYAIDLLGFGASEKPEGFAYTMEVWSQLILDFLDEVIKKPTVLVGNSVGSLACVIAASETAKGLVRGIVLLNCAGGMNNKAVVDDWRIKLVLPLLWIVDFLLKQRGIASTIFSRVKQRENLKNILLSVYGNKESVDDDLVEIIRRPADDVGALDAFVSIVTGPPGPSPMSLMPRISIPVLVLWGNQDPFTPLDGPVGKYFSSLPSELSNVKLHVLEGVGHCPHDDRPDLVHEKLIPWLASLPA